MACVYISSWTVVVFSLLLHFSKNVRTKGISVCYYRNWAQYEKGKAKFLPEDIDPELCSVINYAAMKVNLHTHRMEGRQWNDGDMLRRITLLKRKNPYLKVFLSIGGWNHEKLPRFSRMVARRSKRKIFIQSVIRYLQYHKLDGINIDWEYPTFRHGSSPKDKRKLTFLLREIFFTFYTHSRRTNEKRYHLTLSVSANPRKIAAAYQIKKIAKYVDWVEVMAYNLRGPWRDRTGCPTLMQGPEPTVPAAIFRWLENGMPASKLNLGMVTYGRTFRLKNKMLNRDGDPAMGKGFPGLHTNTSGILSYYEICSTRWKSRTSGSESACGTPYASLNHQWVAYDDVESVEDKVQLLVNSMGLNGVSFWALDFDDFTGSYCGQGKYPLLNAAVRAMAGHP